MLKNDLERSLISECVGKEKTCKSFDLDNSWKMERKLSNSRDAS